MIHYNLYSKKDKVKYLEKLGGKNINKPCGLFPVPGAINYDVSYMVRDGKTYSSVFCDLIKVCDF